MPRTSFFPWPLAVLVPALSLLAPGVNAQRRGRGGSGVDFNLDLDATSVSVFSIMIAVAVFTLIQFVASFAFLRRRKHAEHEFPLRFLYGILIICASGALVIYYALAALSWKNENSTGSSAPLSPAAYAFMDLFIRVTDILIYIAVVILLRNRRNAFLAEHGSGMSADDLQAANSPFYRFSPWIMFGMMILTTVIRFGILLGTKPIHVVLRSRFMPTTTPQTFDALIRTTEAFDAMAHLYLAFYLVLTAIVTMSAVVLWTQTKARATEIHIFYDQFVLARLVKFVVPVLVIKALHELITHIIIYDQKIWASGSIHRLGFFIATVVIQRVLYLAIFFALLKVGSPPKPKEGSKMIESQNGGTQRLERVHTSA